MSTPRPGVAAAKRLAVCTDTTTWLAVEAQYSAVETQPKLAGLATLREHYCALGHTLQSALAAAADGNRTNTHQEEQEQQEQQHPLSITRDELFLIVNWKFKVGKPRNALWKYLKANTAASVKEHSAIAMQHILYSRKHENTHGHWVFWGASLKSALQALTQLQGVGPATAAAVVSLVAPNNFAYMYDEVLDCFAPKRTYTLPTYLSMNTTCHDIATILNNKNPTPRDWTPARVARSLWIAARANAYELHDHTVTAATATVKKKEKRATTMETTTTTQMAATKKKQRTTK